MFRVERIPQNAVRDHPAIRQKDVRAELDRDHLVIHLDDDPADPAAYALLVLFMIAIDFHRVADLKVMLAARSPHVSELWHAWTLNSRGIAVCGARRRDAVDHTRGFHSACFCLRTVGLRRSLSFNYFLRFFLHF